MLIATYIIYLSMLLFKFNCSNDLKLVNSIDIIILPLSFETELVNNIDIIILSLSFEGWSWYIWLQCGLHDLIGACSRWLQYLWEEMLPTTDCTRDETPPTSVERFPACYSCLPTLYCIVLWALATHQELRGRAVVCENACDLLLGAYEKKVVWAISHKHCVCVSAN